MEFILVLTIVTTNSLNIKDYGKFNNRENCEQAAKTYMNIFNGKSTPYKKLINYDCIKVSKCLNTK